MDSMYNNFRREENRIALESQEILVIERDLNSLTKRRHKIVKEKYLLDKTRENRRDQGQRQQTVHKNDTQANISEEIRSLKSQSFVLRSGISNKELKVKSREISKCRGCWKANNRQMKEMKSKSATDSLNKVINLIFTEKFHKPQRHLRKMEKVINSEISKLKQQKIILEKDLKNKGVGDVLPTTSSITWAEKFTKTPHLKQQHKNEKVSNELYSKEHTCVCASSRYAGIGDLVIRPKTRTISTQMSKACGGNIDCKGWGDHHTEAKEHLVNSSIWNQSRKYHPRVNGKSPQNNIPCDQQMYTSPCLEYNNTENSPYFCFDKKSRSNGLESISVPNCSVNKMDKLPIKKYGIRTKSQWETGRKRNNQNTHKVRDCYNERSKHLYGHNDLAATMERVNLNKIDKLRKKLMKCLANENKLTQHLEDYNNEIYKIEEFEIGDREKPSPTGTYKISSHEKNYDISLKIQKPMLSTNSHQMDRHPNDACSPTVLSVEGHTPKENFQKSYLGTLRLAEKMNSREYEPIKPSKNDSISRRRTESVTRKRSNKLNKREKYKEYVNQYQIEQTNRTYIKNNWNDYSLQEGEKAKEFQIMYPREHNNNTPNKKPKEVYEKLRSKSRSGEDDTKVRSEQKCHRVDSGPFERDGANKKRDIEQFDKFEENGEKFRNNDEQNGEQLFQKEQIFSNETKTPSAVLAIKKDPWTFSSKGENCMETKRSENESNTLISYVKIRKELQTENDACKGVTSVSTTSRIKNEGNILIANEAKSKEPQIEKYFYEDQSYIFTSNRKIEKSKTRGSHNYYSQCLKFSKDGGELSTDVESKNESGTLVSDVKIRKELQTENDACKGVTSVSTTSRIKNEGNILIADEAKSKEPQIEKYFYENQPHIFTSSGKIEKSKTRESHNYYSQCPKFNQDGEELSTDVERDKYYNDFHNRKQIYSTIINMIDHQCDTNSKYDGTLVVESEFAQNTMPTTENTQLEMTEKIKFPSSGVSNISELQAEKSPTNTNNSKEIINNYNPTEQSEFKGIEMQSRYTAESLNFKPNPTEGISFQWKNSPNFYHDSGLKIKTESGSTFKEEISTTFNELHRPMEQSMISESCKVSNTSEVVHKKDSFKIPSDNSSTFGTKYNNNEWKDPEEQGSKEEYVQYFTEQDQLENFSTHNKHLLQKLSASENLFKLPMDPYKTELESEKHLNSFESIQENKNVTTKIDLSDICHDYGENLKYMCTRPTRESSKEGVSATYPKSLNVVKCLKDLLTSTLENQELKKLIYELTIKLSTCNCSSTIENSSIYADKSTYMDQGENTVETQYNMAEISNTDPTDCTRIKKEDIRQIISTTKEPKIKTQQNIDSVRTQVNEIGQIVESEDHSTFNIKQNNELITDCKNFVWINNQNRYLSAGEGIQNVFGHNTSQENVKDYSDISGDQYDIKKNGELFPKVQAESVYKNIHSPSRESYNKQSDFFLSDAVTPLNDISSPCYSSNCLSDTKQMSLATVCESINPEVCSNMQRASRISEIEKVQHSEDSQCKIIHRPHIPKSSLAHLGTELSQNKRNIQNIPYALADNLPAFTNCPCMLGTYLQILDIYLKWKHKLSLSK